MLPQKFHLIVADKFLRRRFLLYIYSFVKIGPPIVPPPCLQGSWFKQLELPGDTSIQIQLFLSNGFWEENNKKKFLWRCDKFTTTTDNGQILIKKAQEWNLHNPVLTSLTLLISRNLQKPTRNNIQLLHEGNGGFITYVDLLLLPFTPKVSRASSQPDIYL